MGTDYINQRRIIQRDHMTRQPTYLQGRERSPAMLPIGGIHLWGVIRGKFHHQWVRNHSPCAL